MRASAKPHLYRAKLTLLTEALKISLKGDFMRYTGDDRMNRLIDMYVKEGWSFERGTKHPRLIPPQEIIDANPGKTPFVIVGGTPSDHRIVANTRSLLRSYVDPRPKTPRVRRTVSIKSVEQDFDVITSHFCVICGPMGPEFDTLEERAKHMSSEHKQDKPSRLDKEGPKKNPYEKKPCPLCTKPIAPQGLRTHVFGKHSTSALATAIVNLPIKEAWNWQEPDSQVAATEAIEAVETTPETESTPQPKRVDSIPNDLQAKEFTDTLMGLLFPNGVVVHDSESMRKLSTWVNLSYEIYIELHR